MDELRRGVAGLHLRFRSRNNSGRYKGCSFSERRDKIAVIGLGDTIGRSSKGLETCTIAHEDATSAGLDEVFAFKDVKFVGYACSAHANACGDLIMVDKQFVATNSIVPHQKPSSDAAFNAVFGVRGDRPSHLNDH